MRTKSTLPLADSPPSWPSMLAELSDAETSELMTPFWIDPMIVSNFALKSF